MLPLEKILRTAKIRGLNQRAVEQRAELAANRISKLKMQGGELVASEVFRVARVLGVSCDYLLDDTLTDPATPSGLSAEQAKLILVAEELGYKKAMARLLKDEESVEWERDGVTRKQAL